MRSFLSSLRIRVLLAVLLAVLPALALMLITASADRDQAMADARSEALRVVRLAASNQAQFIEHAWQTLVRLFQLPALRLSDLPACSDVFGELQTVYLQEAPRYANLGLIDPQGNVYCSLVPVSGDVNVLARPYFQRALRTLDFAVGDYELDSSIDKTTLNFVYPVLDFAGDRVRVVLFAALDLAWLDRLIDQERLPEGSTFSVIDRNGTILSRYPDPARWVGLVMLETPVVQAVLQEAAEGTIEAVDSQGVRRLYAYAPLGSATSASASVVMGIPSSVIFAKADAQLARNLTALGLVVVFTLASAWVASEAFILRRVRALVATTRQLSAGNLGARTGVAYGSGELAQLAGAFDSMAAALELREKERQAAETALREREEQYRSIFESTSDGLIINGLDGRIVEANPAACRMHGYAREEFIGQHLTQLVHPDHHYLIEELIRKLSAGEPFQARAVDVRKDGTTFDVEVRGSRLTHQGQPRLMSVVRDVTDQVRAYQMLEERVVERTRELSTLLEVSHSVASTLELKPLLGLILDQLFKMVEYHAATIFILQGDELIVLDHRGPIPIDQALRIRLPLDRAGVNRAVMRRKEPILVDDVRGDTDRAREFRATAGDQLDTTFGYVRSWMGVPLMIKEWVIGMLSLDHGEPSFYTPRHAKLALAIATQAAVAIENARLYEQAQTLAALEERQKLARELHDSVSQALYGIALGARTARTLADRDPGKVAEPLDYVLSLAEAGLAEMRALIFELRPESLETEGLIAALTKQAASLRARHNLDVRTDLCEEPDVPLDVKVALYRIAQEAQHNVVKHARAQRVDVRMACEAGVIRLEVCDDGVGFDPDGEFPGHLGLRSMHERIQRLGGTLQFDSAPGKGTCVRVQIPLRVTSPVV